jgi:hypothetical protein
VRLFLLRRSQDHPREAVEFFATAAELVAYVVTALAMLWPVTFELGSRIAGWKDARYYSWASWRVGEMLRSGDLGLRIPDIVWPYGVDIRHVDGQLPTLIGGLWNLVASPELAHNLGLMTGIALNLWAGRRLGRAFSSHRAVWALTAIAFATTPAIAARLEVHFTMYFAFPVALLLEEAVHVARGDRPLRPIRLGVLLFVTYLCGIYFLLFGAIAFGLIALLGSLPRELPGMMLRASGGVALALVLLSPFLIARLDIDRAEREAGRNPELLARTLVAEADGLSIVAQPSSSTFDIPGMSRLRQHFREHNVHESTIFPGLLLLGGLSGLIFLRSPLRWPLFFTTIAMWILALGTSLKIDGRFVVTAAASPRGTIVWLPYAGFFEIPGLASLRSPNRASFTLAAVLTVATALSLGWLFDRYGRRWQRVTMSAVAGSLLVTNLLIPIHAEVIASPALSRALRTVAQRVRPDEAMVEVPAECGGQTHTVLFQILHRTPVIGCQTSHPAIRWRSSLELYRRSEALASLRCDPRRVGSVPTSFTEGERFDPKEVAELRAEMGVRFYLVDKKRLNSRMCAGARESLRILERYEIVGQDRKWMVIDTGPVTGAAP